MQAIPIAMAADSKDNLIWMGSKDGEFDLKEAYRCAAELGPPKPFNGSWVRWERPSRGWVKLNTDGSSLGNPPGLAGSGGLIRNEEGAWIVGFARNIGIATGFQAELWGLRDGLAQCVDQNFAAVEVELDAKSVLAVLESPSCSNNPNAPLVNDCKDLASKIAQIRFKHCYKKANRAADKLARIGARQESTFQIFLSPPEDVACFLNSDRNGVNLSRARSTGANWVQKETGDSVHRHSPVGADRLAEETGGGEDGSPVGKWNNLQQMSQDSVPRNSEYKPKFGGKNRPEWHSHGGKDGFANIVRSEQGINSPESVGSRSKQFKRMGTPDSAHKQDFPQLSGQSDSEDLDAGRIQIGKILSVDSITLQDDLPNRAGPSNKGASLEVNMEFKLKISVHLDETQVLSVSAKKYKPSSSKDPKSSAGHKNLEHSEHSTMLDSFDLCPTKSEKTVTLKPPLLLQNRERRNEIKSSLEGQNGIVLRAGMVLLKGYISFSDQVKIVKKCRDLGLGPGGFYQPGYCNGAKLRLKMMCLGKNWDPETGNYGDHRPVDEAKPPTIPAEFYQLVKKSIEDSHSLIQKNSKSSNVESVLPWMSPNICIVNYYSENGRLGLHQDRDESQESLAKGLPVASFSIGDKADFLYGDQRDVDKAEKVALESGDVLIFGGKSRHIFHGVTAIHPNSAPKSLLEETKLRPGRLNLTFREY